MEGVRRVASLLASLELTNLTELAKQLYEEHDFNHSIHLADVYTSHLLSMESRLGISLHQLLDQVTEELRRVIEEKDRDDETNEHYAEVAKAFWQELALQNVEFRCLGVLLFCLLCDKKSVSAKGGSCHRDWDRDSDNFEVKTSAASCTFVLCSLQGSTARLLHPLLVLEAFKVFNTDTMLSEKRRGCAKRANRRQSGANKRRKQLHSDTETWDVEESQSTRLQDEEGHEKLGCSLNVPHLLQRVLHDLLLMIKELSLRDYDEIREHLVSLLARLTRLETSAGYSNLEFNESTRHSSRSSLAFNAYIGLERLCSNEQHGSKDSNVRLVLQRLMPSILMSYDGNDANTQKELNVVREHTVHFALHLVQMVGEESFESLVILIQHVAVSVQDRIEFRTRGCQSIRKLMGALPQRLWIELRNWFQKATCVERVALRHFALEVLPFLLRSPFFDESLDELSFSVIFARLWDTAPTVKARALQAINELCENEYDRASLYHLFSDDSRDMLREDEHFFMTLPEILGSLHTLDVNERLGAVVPSSQLFIKVIQSKTNDESVCVRKAALSLISTLLKRQEFYSTTSITSSSLLMSVGARSRDTSLTVRRQVASLLSELINQSPKNEELTGVFVQCLFPMMLDNEARAAEKATESVYSSLFGNLAVHHEDNTGNNSEEDENSRAKRELPWQILHSASKQGLMEYLSQACRHWAHQQLLDDSIFPLLQSHIGQRQGKGAWLLLATLSEHLKLLQPSFVVKHFVALCTGGAEYSLFELLQVLRVLSSSLLFLKPETQRRLKMFLIQIISDFKLPLELISAAIDVVAISQQIESNDGCESNGRTNHHWASLLIQTIEVELCRLASKTSTSEDKLDNEQLVLRQVLTLGELALLAPNDVSNNTFQIVHSLVFYQQDEANARCLTLLSLKPGKQLSSVAVLTLTKICFYHENLAKTTVPSLGLLLTAPNADNDMKVNTLSCLSDMCVRYASLVDPLVHNMTSCLSDKSKDVRKSALVTLVHLLQQDYLKIRNRSSFFFRLLQVLRDSNEDISNLCKFYLLQRLFKRQPKICYQHFVEAIFFFNEYQGHPKYKLETNVRPLNSLKGSESERMLVFKFLLENMSDHERFHSTHNLCQEILNALIEGVIEIDDQSRPLITDTLSLLGSDEIKLSTLRRQYNDDTSFMSTHNGENNNTGNDNEEAALVAVAKKTIISQLVRKNVMEHIMPILISLRNLLENRGEKVLLKHLMTCLRELMRDYRNELRDMFESNSNLATEISEEIKRFEEQQQISGEQCAQIARRRQSQAQSNDLLKTILHSEALRARNQRQIADLTLNPFDLSSLPIASLDASQFTPRIVLQDINKSLLE